MSAKYCLGLNSYTSDRFPECALGVETEAIVTGESRDVENREFRELRILSLSACLG